MRLHVTIQRHHHSTDLITMQYDFHTAQQRAGIGCEKYDKRRAIFGTEQVIPLWVADMDFAAPAYITEALAQRAALPSYGYAERMDSWAVAVSAWLDRHHHWHVPHEWLLPTAGVVPSLAMLIQLLSERGDGVIIQPPVYFPFYGLVTENQRELLLNPLREVDGQYRMDLEQLSELLPRARLLILCNPHNPGGRAWREDELNALAKLCAAHDVMVLSDEIHMDLTYPGHHHLPFARVASTVCQYITVTSSGKTFNTAGIGGGYAIIENTALRQALQRRQQVFHLGGEQIFSLLATETAYRLGHDWPVSLMSHIAAMRDQVIGACDGSPITPMLAEASYLLWLDCRRLEMDDNELQRFFIERAGLGLSAGSVFGEQGRGFMRINLATTPAIMTRAMQQLHMALNSL